MSETIRELTVQISANGASTAQKDIKGLQNAVQQADAKFKAAGAGIKNFESTTAGMQARVTMLNEKLSAQKGVVDKAAASLEKAKAKMTTAAAEQQKYAQKIETAKAALAAEVAATGKDSEASKALAADLQKLEGQHAALAKSAQTAAQGVQKADIALEQAKAVVKGTEAELRAANATLKTHGSAWAQAGAKIAAAGDKMTAWGKKTSTIGKNLTMGVTVPIGAAGVAAYKAWDTIDNGLDTVIRKTGATGDALVPLEAAYNNVFLGVKTTAEDAGIAVGEVNTRFKSTGTELEGLSKTFIQFADVNKTDLNESIGKTSRILSQWKQPTSAATGFLGLLTSEAQRTGISVDQLMDSVQTNGATLKGMNLNLSQSVQFMADFEAAGINADTALAALKKSTVLYTKEGVTLEQGFSATVNGIKAAKDETEALALAQKVFGAKGALEMATAIREGRLSVTGLSADMSRMGDVVGKTFNEINGDTVNLDRVKNKLVQTGATFGRAMLPWIEQAAGKLGELVDGFANLDPAIQQNIVGIAGIAAAVGPALSGIGKVAQGIGAVAKLFSGPAGWVALAIGALAGVGVWLSNIKTPSQKMADALNKIKIRVDEKSKTAITDAIDEGIEAANKEYEIKVQAKVDATAMKSEIDSALSDQDITSKEFNAISTFVNEKVSADIDTAKKALAIKVGEYKAVLQSMTDAQGNAQYTDEEVDVMTADFEAKNSQLIVDIQKEKQNLLNLLAMLQGQRAPINDAQIAQIEEQLAKMAKIQEQLRIISDQASAAGRANYALVTSGQGGNEAVGQAIGYVSQNRIIAETKAAEDRQAMLAAAGEDTIAAANAWKIYYAAMDVAGKTAQKSYQEIADGIAKMSGADTTLETIVQDSKALEETFKALSDSKNSEDWLKKVTDTFGPNSLLRKYLSSEDSGIIDSILKNFDPNNPDVGDFSFVYDLATRLSQQLTASLEENKKDPKLNPIIAYVQSLVDKGALEGIDLTGFTGAMEDAITVMNIPKTFEDNGADAGASLAGGITASTSSVVGAVHGVFGAAIAAANIDRKLLQNAMGFVSGGGTPVSSYYGKSNEGPTNYNSNLNINEFYASGSVDVDVLLTQLNRRSTARQVGRGYRS